MRKAREIQSQDFETLLHWLDSDRAQAGIKYERIRGRLIQIFILRGCPDAEQLADETIDRVVLKCGELVHDYKGDPALYFYGVARLVYLESLRSLRRKEIPLETAKVVLSPENNSNAEEDCLEQCLNKLQPEQRDLLLDYFQDDKQAKINHRKALAERFGITSNVLRIRISRLKNTLQTCVEHCLGGN